MTTRIIYLKDHDGHKTDKEYNIERSLAGRLIENGIAELATTREARLKAEKITKQIAKDKIIKEKKKVDKLISEKDAPIGETAVSKKRAGRKKKIETAETVI